MEAFLSSPWSDFLFGGGILFFLGCLVWYASQLKTIVGSLVENIKEHKEECDPHRADIDKRLVVVETIQASHR